MWLNVHCLQRASSESFLSHIPTGGKNFCPAAPGRMGASINGVSKYAHYKRRSVNNSRVCRWTRVSNWNSTQRQVDIFRVSWFCRRTATGTSVLANNSGRSSPHGGIRKCIEWKIIGGVFFGGGDSFRHQWQFLSFPWWRAFSGFFWEIVSKSVTFGKGCFLALPVNRVKSGFFVVGMGYAYNIGCWGLVGV